MLDQNELKNFINEQFLSERFSGNVFIVQDDKSILELTLGLADREQKIPNTLKTKFNIGSLDKMFTAVAIAQLVEKGKLSFDDKVGKFLKNIPQEIAKQMSIVHLLTHQDGLSSYFNDLYIKQRLTLDDVSKYMELFIHEPLFFSPGEKYQYSNSGFVVLGAIIEEVTGESYYQYVRKNIFEKATMPDTGSFTLKESNLAVGYTKRLPFSKNEGAYLRSNSGELPFIGSPAGGGYSTVFDLYNFAQALLGNKLLSSDMTDQLLTPHITVGTKNGQTLYYGYGFQILDVGDGNKRIGHAGSFAGVNVRLDMYPWKNTVVVVMANRDEPIAFQIANKAMELIISEN